MCLDCEGMSITGVTEWITRSRRSCPRHSTSHCWWTGL